MTWRDLKNDERYEMRIAWGLGGPLGASPIVFVALPDPHRSESLDKLEWAREFIERERGKDATNAARDEGEVHMIPATIDRLDYSKPPTEYLVHDLNDDGWWWRIDEPEDGCTSSYETEADCRAAAWAHYKAHNDPPGMSVVPRTLRQGSVEQQVWCFTPAVDVAPEWSWSVEEAQARAAAWAWYDRRLAVTEKLDRARSDAEAHRGVELRSRPLPPHHWPRCLTWPDVQVAEVDRWLVDSAAEMPEVLRG